ncbi:MAG: hypothetical protein ABF649_09535 [Bacillus sp. (in: firmicutes)]
MKKKMKIAAVVLSLGAVLVTGKLAFAADSNNETNQMMKTSNMSTMMDNESMSNMKKMMEDPNMNKMMDDMDSPEGKKMMKSCDKFMESSQDKKASSKDKDNDLKSKQTSSL